MAGNSGAYRHVVLVKFKEGSTEGTLRGIEAAMTIVESPPVAVATLVEPRSIVVMSAGAPAAPFPATPTSTTAMMP